MASGPWPCVVAGTAKRPEQVCKTVPRTGVYFPELRGGVWEGELPRGPGSIPLSPLWGLGISGSIPGSGAPSAPARCSPPSRSQGYVHKGTAVRRSAWAVLGVSSPREHRPPRLGSSASGAGRAAGQPGWGGSPAVLLFPPGGKPPAGVTHGSAASGFSPWEEGSWCWHGRCGDVAWGLGGLGALGLLSLPVAHDSSTLALICSR